MRFLAVLVALATLTVAAPAHADWQWTKWGMTPDEVIAASGGRAAFASDGALRLSDKVTVAGHDFSVFFTFDKGKLSRVSLEGDRVWFQGLDLALSGAFGQPMNRIEGDPIYVDRVKGNLIWLIHGTYVLTIQYRPIETSF